MKRRIIEIDKEKCNGCGLCVTACHEGAIGLVDGKAKLLRDDYCDGLGDCLPVCPTGAITFVEREAKEYNKEEVEKNMAAKKKTSNTPPCGCPGTNIKTISRANEESEDAIKETKPLSRLGQWPVQIKLVPIEAPYFDNANLLIAADCTAYAYAGMHNEFMRNRITLIGCPKLDDTDYAQKLTAILSKNNIKTVTVVRMEVPCCGGIETALKTALINSGKMIPWQVVTISTDGQVLDY